MVTMYLVKSVLCKMASTVVVLVAACALVAPACVNALQSQEVKSPGKAPWIPLNDGRIMPGFGLGTWLGFGGDKTVPSKPSVAEVQRAVEWAIDAGYRHIDTAAIYDTEGQVGDGLRRKIKDGAVRREDIFVTTKLWNDAHAEEDVVPALRKSLAALGLDYVDLYLIHWPIAQYKNFTYPDIDYVSTWRGMQQARTLGLTKSIGVSNFNQKQLARLIEETGVSPAVLQVEINLNLQQPELLSLCREHNIAVMAYTPFGSLLPTRASAAAPPPRVDDPELMEVAKAHGKTVTQVVLRYLVELGVVPIPKSVKKNRIEENIDIYDFSLTPNETDLFKKYDKNYRTIDVSFWEPSPHYPFEKKKNTE